MSRHSRRAPLRLVHLSAQLVDGLLAAPEEWAAPGRASEPAAYLEAGDGELLGGFPLTAGKVSELTTLLRDAAGHSCQRQARHSLPSPHISGQGTPGQGAPWHSTHGQGTPGLGTGWGRGR
jgi:hypothetical protein